MRSMKEHLTQYAPVELYFSQVDQQTSLFGMHFYGMGGRLYTLSVCVHVTDRLLPWKCILSKEVSLEFELGWNDVPRSLTLLLPVFGDSCVPDVTETLSNRMIPMATTLITWWRDETLSRNFDPCHAHCTSLFGDKKGRTPKACGCQCR